nr:GGDEF domain-containing protein [Oleiphilus messinensis]
MLSFALAEKINREKRLRILAQEQALSIQNKYNAKLESTVAARTQELEALNSQLLQLSTTDSLTGLKNRRYLDQYLNEELARLARSQRPMAVLLLDIDHFKQFNDSHGHLAGDECLKRVALSLESCIRWPSDRATRYGGEEFCIVLPETHAEDAQNVAERIRNKIETQKIEWEGKAISITVSIGVQIAGQDFQGSPTNLLSLADQALYASKQNGRNQVTLSSVTC